MNAGSKSGSSTPQVVNSWAKSKPREEEIKPVSVQAVASTDLKEGAKKSGGSMRFTEKKDNEIQDLQTKESKMSPRLTLKVFIN